MFGWSSRKQETTQKEVTIQQSQRTQTFLDALKGAIDQIKFYENYVNKLVSSPKLRRNKDFMSKLEIQNMYAGQSLNLMKIHIESLLEYGDDLSLKLGNNLFFKYWKYVNNPQFNPKVLEKLLPLLLYLVKVFQGKETPVIPAPLINSSNFNSSLVQNTIDCYVNGKLMVDNKNKYVKNNHKKYVKKHMSEFSNKETNKNYSSLQNINTDNVNTNYKNILQNYDEKKLDKESMNYDNNNYNDAPDLWTGNIENLNINNNNNNNNNNKYITNYNDSILSPSEVELLKKGDLIDYKYKDGKYYLCQVLKNVNGKYLMLALHNKSQKICTDSNNYERELNNFAKPRSISQRGFRIMFNHIYFSNKNYWDVGNVTNFDNGFIFIKPHNNNIKSFWIHIDNFDMIQFNPLHYLHYNQLQKEKQLLNNNKNKNNQDNDIVMNYNKN